jgi:hypothetical protein
MEIGIYLELGIWKLGFNPLRYTAMPSSILAITIIIVRRLLAMFSFSQSFSDARDQKPQDDQDDADGQKIGCAYLS